MPGIMLAALSYSQPTQLVVRFESKSPKRPAMVATPELKLETVTTLEETRVRCIGRMTSTSSATFQTAIRDLIPEKKRLLLDLADVTYLDSFGLGALVSVYLSARRQHCELRLINMTQQAKELLRITNLSSLIE